MEPLHLLERELQSGMISEKIYLKVKKRMKYLLDAVSRVEKASGLKYPPYYISPYLTLMRSGAEAGELGVLFARVIPTTATGSLVILVEFSSALVALAAKGTVEAVAAHEFTHYVELVRKILRMSITSDESSTTLFESGYSDQERTIDPRLLFKERSLVLLVKRKFNPNLNDEKLVSKVEKEWVSKGLPTKVIAPEENVVRLNSATVAAASFETTLINRIKEIEEKAES